MPSLYGTLVAYQKKNLEGTSMKKLIPFLLAICLLFTLAGCGDSAAETPTVVPTKEAATEMVQPYLDITGYSYEGLIAKMQEKGVEEATAKATVEAADLDYNQQAVRRATGIMKSLPYSYNGIISKLEAEQFTPEQAKYAADHCGADWKEQAAQKAKAYMALGDFPESQLLDQLLYDGFSQEQAQYGANSIKK